jgi:tetratricopeptide (TPR) repeat protein
VHADIAGGLNNLASAYGALGGTANLERAIGYFEESLTIQRQRFPGGVHEGIAASLGNLGKAYWKLGGTANLKRAIGHFEESLKIERQLYPGSVHADIATNLNNLGNAYWNLGGTADLERAIGYFEEGLKIERQLYPDAVHAGNAASLYSLLTVKRFLVGQYAEALRDARESLEFLPNDLSARINEATALLLMDREAEALAIYTQYRDRWVSFRATFREAVLSYFAALRALGVNHPGMAKVEALYGQPAVTPDRAKP